jgi:ribosome-associated protein
MDPENGQDTSKSQRKRDAKKIQDLASTLLQMSDSQFNRIPFPEVLDIALRQGRKIKSHVARKRQMQFIAKLLRQHDLTPIMDAIALDRDQLRQNTVRFHVLEQWRDRLIEMGDAELAEFCTANPKANRQQLRQLVRNVQKEQNLEKPPASKRLLFKILRELDEQNVISAPL